MPQDVTAARLQQPVIRPFPPDSHTEWDCQCARCGSSCWYERCTDLHCNCDVYEGLATDDHHGTCDTCGGAGGWYVCGSSPEWCEANPLPCREFVERGKIEWFRVRASAG